MDNPETLATRETKPAQTHTHTHTHTETQKTKNMNNTDLTKKSVLYPDVREG
jgi:hypothetical protein